MKFFTAVRTISLFALAIFIYSSANLSGQTPAPTPPIPEEDQVVKVESRLVVVPVSVTDPAGEPVLGLKAADFRIAEDGRTQAIDAVGDAENVPLEIALLIDVSGSVNPLFEFEKSAAGQFLNTVMKPDDRATIFLIGDKPQALLKSENAASAAERLKSVDTVGKIYRLL